jgi:hypothetical protein
VSAFDEIFARVKLTASTVAAGAKRAILANVRGYVTDPADPTVSEASDNEPVFGVVGVVCRPRSADASGFCEGFAVRGDDSLTPVATRDLRLNARVNPIEGEVCIPHYDGGFISLRDSDDGPKKGTQVVILAPVLKPDGTIDTSHSLTLDPSSGNDAIMLLHRLGHGLMLTKDKQAILASANGQNWIGVSDAGITFNGTFALNGAVVAGNPLSGQSVALASPFADALAAMNACLQDCSGGGTITPPHAAALTAALAALATAGTGTTLKASPT